MEQGADAEVDARPSALELCARRRAGSSMLPRVSMLAACLWLAPHAVLAQQAPQVVEPAPAAPTALPAPGELVPPPPTALPAPGELVPPPPTAYGAGVPPPPQPIVAPGAPPQPPARRRHPGLGLIITGASMLGLFYVLPVITTISNGLDSDHDHDFHASWLVPVAGPFLMFDYCDPYDDLCTAGLVFVGIGQIVAAALLIPGIVLAAGASDDDAPARARATRLSPVVARGYEGLALSASF